MPTNQVTERMSRFLQHPRKVANPKHMLECLINLCHRESNIVESVTDNGSAGAERACLGVKGVSSPLSHGSSDGVSIAQAGGWHQPQ